MYPTLVLVGWSPDGACSLRLGNKIKSTIKFSKDSKKTLELDVSEYLRYEKEILPDQLEIDEFTSLVDKLRNDVDRLKLRIDKITRISPTQT